MNTAILPWVLFVAGKPSGSYSDSLLRQAQSLTAIAKACCVMHQAHLDVWQSFSNRFWPSNVFFNGSNDPIIEGVKKVLDTLADREPSAAAVLIPINHCAVEEATWLASIQGAVRLGIGNPDTVYILHDKPDNDPRVALNRPELCSSSVMIGSVRSLLDLCHGERTTTIVDLTVDDAQKETDPKLGVTPQGNPPLHVVHIRLAQEYALLQRGCNARHRTGAVDVHA